ncbi:SDR family NAD(P)-dependent oxidoreductase [Isobaculum melis]|uniref:Short-chain dehydrogenase n=1 Tax=Isobaculum melis TaxID=142588 RepID=A0A1H9STD0_9LACT|nr:SDR family NAD(P)-dependent oxidoreductase [Isobaculum melis]SER88095.1 hypothetical protein SAMN04488559_10919 [Isobaculum melis]
MKYTVITGASSGIGLETAKAFAKEGKNLILVARREQRLQVLKEEILKEHPTLKVVLMIKDLSVRNQVLAFYQETKVYQVETWINNAGLGYYGAVGEQSMEKIQQLIQLNIEALTILSTCYIADYEMIEGTQLINVSSTGGYKNVPNAVTYCATKFYVSAFTEGLALELKVKKAPLQAKILAPAATETEFAQVANHSASYDYQKGFKQFHSSKEMAQFLLDLYHSNQVVGLVNRDTFEFKLSEPLFDHYEGAMKNM